MSEHDTEQDEAAIDRDSLAKAVAEECDRLASDWWDDRESYRWALEHDPFWEEPNYWLNETRPPVRSCGDVLTRILSEYEPGEQVDVVELLRWTWQREKADNQDGYRRLAHGFYRASKAIREESGIGYPEVDHVHGEVA